MTGVIKNLIKDKMFGFIKGKDGKEYFFHKSGLKNIQFEQLTEGREVTFEDAEGKEGKLRAEDIFV